MCRVTHCYREKKKLSAQSYPLLYTQEVPMLHPLLYTREYPCYTPGGILKGGYLCTPGGDTRMDTTLYTTPGYTPWYTSLLPTPPWVYFPPPTTAGDVTCRHALPVYSNEALGSKGRSSLDERPLSQSQRQNC